jgi:hypothetical protein
MLRGHMPMANWELVLSSTASIITAICGVICKLLEYLGRKTPKSRGEQKSKPKAHRPDALRFYTKAWRISTGLCVVFLAVTVWLAVPFFTRVPSIRITKAPPASLDYESTRPISGDVSGVNPRKYRVVIYAYTNQWYIQPFDTPDTKVTSIQEDGGWVQQTHPGSSYAALLVKPTYSPPAKTLALPNLGGDVLASTQKDAAPDVPRTGGG